MFEKETEEIFRKNFPQYCSRKELLSPYWDLFESGVNFGYNKVVVNHCATKKDLCKEKQNNQNNFNKRR